MEKVIRDWKVAIVISPRFGAWWYTWNTKYAELLFHPKIVEMVEQWKGNEMTQEWIIDNIWIWISDDESYEYICTLWNGGLTIQWLPEWTKFRVHEYDGSESIWTDKDLDLIA